MAGNLVKPLLSLYGTEWRERGYGLGLYATSGTVRMHGHWAVRRVVSSIKVEICPVGSRAPLLTTEVGIVNIFSTGQFPFGAHSGQS